MFDRNKYQREYYKKNKERLRKYYREYNKRRYKGLPKDDPKRIAALKAWRTRRKKLLRSETKSI